MYKWILGIIGFYIFRLPGFFIGLFIGHQIDKNSFIKIRNNIKKEFELNLLALASILIKSDGNVSKSEIEKLLEFTRYLNISRIDFESIKAMFFKSSDSDYKILEIDKNCTNDELKKAYRELAKKHHPDKVQNLGEVYVKAAKEKFSKIQAAYENIKKQRGI